MKPYVETLTQDIARLRRIAGVNERATAHMLLFGTYWNCLGTLANPLALSLMIAVAMGLIVYLRHKGWLGKQRLTSRGK